MAKHKPEKLAKSPSADPEPDRGPKVHTMLPGDQVREPDELDVLTREPAPGESGTDASGIEDRARKLLDDLKALKQNERFWRNDVSDTQRKVMLGARLVLAELLEEKDDHGRPASLQRSLGFSIATGRALGHGT